MNVQSAGGAGPTVFGMHIVTALGAGLVAGLALAVPLGPIGVLLVQEGAARGWSRGAPAAVAVAGVDLLYCVVALAAGAMLSPVIAGWGAWPRIAGGAALIALAAWELLHARESASDADASAPAAERSPSWQRVALFLGLTAINPVTLLYFAAVAAGIPAVTSSAASASSFTVGVAIASLTWQLLLVTVGAGLRHRTGRRFRRVTSSMGNGVVALLGLLMVVSAVI